MGQEAGLDAHPARDPALPGEPEETERAQGADEDPQGEMRPWRLHPEPDQGDPQEGGGWALRAHIKPFANWIWAGAFLMALGGVLSLADRRVRIAAPARRPAAVPAE